MKHEARGGLPAIPPSFFGFCLKFKVSGFRFVFGRDSARIPLVPSFPPALLHVLPIAFNSLSVLLGVAVNVGMHDFEDLCRSAVQIMGEPCRTDKSTVTLIAFAASLGCIRLNIIAASRYVMYPGASLLLSIGDRLPLIVSKAGVLSAPPLRSPCRAARPVGAYSP